MECKKAGGAKELNQLYSRIESINRESWKILQDEVIATLDIEQSVDVQIRTKLASKWVRTDSGTLQKEYRKQIETIAGHLTTAIETNSKIEKSLKDNELTFTAFDREREELAADLPNVDEIKDSEEAEQLKVFLDELSGIIGERDKLKEEYEGEVNNLDLAQLFMANQEASNDTVANMAKMPLVEIEKKIEEGIKAQIECLEKISTQNELFVGSKENDPKQTQREEMIHVLNESYNKFKDAERHLKEGLKFYSDLMADYILPLKDEIDNFCAARESERDFMLADLQTNIQKLGIDVSGKPNNAQMAPGQGQQAAPMQQQPPQEEQKSAPVQNPPAQAPMDQFQQHLQQQQQQPPQGQQPPQQPPYNPAQPPQQGYNPFYSQAPPQQYQQPQATSPHQPPQQYQQPPQQQPPQQYQQPPQQQPPYQPQYGQPPQQQYQQPPQQWQQPPQQQYGQPPQQWQQPPQQYQQPPQQYQQPPQNYQAPPQNYQYPPQQQAPYNPNYQQASAPPSSDTQPSAPPQ